MKRVIAICGIKRKRVVKKTIEKWNQELGVFGFFSAIFFLLPCLLFLFYVFVIK